jgi:hypothetical protein
MPSEPKADPATRPDSTDGPNGTTGTDSPESTGGSARRSVNGFGPDWPLQDRAGVSQSWPTGLQPVPEMNGWAVHHSSNGGSDGNWDDDSDGNWDDDAVDEEDGGIDPFDFEVGAAPFTITADLTEVFGPPGRGDASVAEAPKPPRPPHIQPIKPRRRSAEADRSEAIETDRSETSESESGSEPETVGAAPPMPPRSLAVDGPGEPPSAFPHGEDDVEWGGS